MSDKKTWRHGLVQWLANVLGVELYSYPTVVVVDITNVPGVRCERTDGDGEKVH